MTADFVGLVPVSKMEGHLDFNPGGDENTRYAGRGPGLCAVQVPQDSLGVEFVSHRFFPARDFNGLTRTIVVRESTRVKSFFA